VVTGTLIAGQLRPDDELVLLPSGRPAKVRGLQVHGEARGDAVAGQRVRRRRLWDLGAVRYVLSSRPLSAGGLSLLEDGEVRLYENKRALPMAYFAGQVQTGIGPDEAFKALTDPADPRHHWPRPALLEKAAAAQTAPGEAVWVEQLDHRWVLRTRVGEGGGTLVLSRIFYPGAWVASIGGQTAQLQPVNAGYSALLVPAGSHEVVLEYKNAAPWGMALFLAGLALAGAVILRVRFV
jgi:hypothetical protein